MISQFIGKNFFYADEETGNGWTSQIEYIGRNVYNSGYTIFLSCGTKVDIGVFNVRSSIELSKLFITNMKED